MKKLLFTLSTAALLSACGDQGAENGTNAVMPSAETRTGGAEPDTGNVVAVDAAAAQQLMKERHDNYEKIGDAMKQVTRELKADSPNLQAVREGATVIATLAPQVPGWFPAGTGPEAGKTEAKAEIWQRPDDFRAKAATFEQAANAFRTASQGNDLGAIRAAHGELGKSCKACHDLYRAKD